MRPWLSSSIAIALLLTPCRAQANPSARLVYVRGPGADLCPHEDAVRAAVSARLGYDPFFLSAPTTIFVEIGRDGDRFVALLKLVDSQGVERGTRHLVTHTGQCVDLIGTLALTLSLVIDPVSLAAPPVLPDTSAPAPASAPASAPAPAPTPALKPTAGEARDSTEVALFAGISALASLGSALAPTAGAVVFGGTRRGWFSVRFEARVDLPASAPQPPAAQSWALVGSTVPCVHKWAAFACGVLGVESIQASGNAAFPRDAETLVALLGARLGAEIPITGRLAVVSFAELLVPLQRPQIQIDGVAVQRFFYVSGDIGLSGLARF